MESGHELCHPSRMRKTSAALLVALIAGCARNPPLLVRASGSGETCTVTVNGEVFSHEELSQPRLQRLAEEHGRRLVVDSDAYTPYRCIGGAVYELQRAGFKVVSVQVGGVPLPSR